MIDEALLQKAMVLLNHKKYDEAEKILGQALATNPDNDYILYLLAEINLQKDRHDKAEQLINSAIALAPDESVYFYLKARLFLLKDKLAEAEENMGIAIQIDPYEADYFAMLAQVKLLKKQYENALHTANQSLELDPNNILGLNIRSTALLKLGRKEESFETIAEALHENPNNAYTHTNYGWGLLEKGDNKKAMEHFREALRNDPNSEYAQNGMAEALKANFVVYRWFLKYAFWMSNMTSKYQWGFIAGIYFATRLLKTLAANNQALAPYVMPIVILLTVFAFSTWVISPVSNLFLRLNPYGRHLLDKEETITSTAVGITLLCSLLCAVTGVITSNALWIAPAVFTFTMMIPLSKLLSSPKGFFISYNTGMFIFGILASVAAFLTGNITNGFAVVYGIGFIGFQFLANYFTVKR